MTWLRNLGGSLLISGAALAASIALAVAVRWDVLPPLFDPQQPVLLAAVIIGLSIIAAGMFSVVLGFYLVQVAALHAMKARLTPSMPCLRRRERRWRSVTDDRPERAPVSTSCFAGILRRRHRIPAE